MVEGEYVPGAAFPLSLDFVRTVISVSDCNLSYCRCYRRIYINPVVVREEGEIGSPTRPSPYLPFDAYMTVMIYYSRIANNGGVMLKGQDIVMLSVLMDGEAAGESYAMLAKRACISVAEAYAAVSRLRAAALVAGDRRVLKQNAMEFLAHGLRYAFPLNVRGTIAKGMPTAYAAPISKQAFAISGSIPVWQSEAGTAVGREVEPLYRTVPAAAAADCRLYDRLALVDMLRGGRLREREFARERLGEMMA